MGITIHNTGTYTTTIEADGHTIITDEPLTLGGQDKGPTPTALLLSSLGSCKAITMRMYAQRKEWPLEDIQIELALESPKEAPNQTTYIKVDIKLIGDLDEQQKERLLKISEKCPFHKILNNSVHINTHIIQ